MELREGREESDDQGDDTSSPASRKWEVIFVITNLFIGGPCLSCRETRSLCSFLWINYFSLNLPATALEGKHFQRRKVTTACLMKGSTGILIPRYEYGL